MKMVVRMVGRGAGEASWRGGILCPKVSSTDKEAPPLDLCWESSEKELVQSGEAKFGWLLHAKLTKWVLGLVF